MFYSFDTELLSATAPGIDSPAPNTALSSYQVVNNTTILEAGLNYLNALSAEGVLGLVYNSSTLTSATSAMSATSAYGAEFFFPCSWDGTDVGLLMSDKSILLFTYLSSAYVQTALSGTVASNSVSYPTRQRKVLLGYI